MKTMSHPFNRVADIDLDKLLNDLSKKQFVETNYRFLFYYLDNGMIDV